MHRHFRPPLCKVDTSYLVRRTYGEQLVKSPLSCACLLILSAASLSAQCYEADKCDNVPLTALGSALTEHDTAGWPKPPSGGEKLIHCERALDRADERQYGHLSAESRGCGDEFKVPVLKYTEIQGSRQVLITQGSTSLTVSFELFTLQYQSKGYLVVNYIAKFQPILDWDHKKPSGTCGGNAIKYDSCRI